MPEDGVDLQPQSKMINQQEILRLASMFVNAGVDKIRLTGGEVRVIRAYPRTLLPPNISAPDERDVRSGNVFSSGLKLPFFLVVQGAAWNGEPAFRLSSFFLP